MSDAQNKLQEALAKAKAKKVKGSPSLQKSKVGPARSVSAPTASSSNTKPVTTKKKTAPKKKTAKKKGPGIGSGLFKNFQNFATSVMDELKTATSEISPGALLSTANDSFNTIKKAVGIENVSDHQEHDPSLDTENTADTNGQSLNRPPASEQTPHAERPAHGAINAQADNTPVEYTSPAKVQRIASKKKKAVEIEIIETQDQQSIPAASSPSQTATTAVSDEELAQATTSPAKVQRASSKQSEAADDTTDIAPTEVEEHLPPEAPQPKETAEPEIEEAPPSAETKEKPSKPVRKPAPTSSAISKTEHAVRSFRSLQIVLNNTIWKPIITDHETKPSTLYAPRERFDTLFVDPTFREGLKAASRLASGYTMPPEKMRFSEKIIAQITSFDLDPQNKIKPHTENLTSVLDEEIVKEVLRLLQDGAVKHLLFSVGTRLGSFVPTIESLARIYLSLRKKEPLSSGDRLKIQEEILMRYKKAPYTEDMGKKARNLALNYFMDYLIEVATKLYKERFGGSQDNNDNRDSYIRRHATIKAFCCDMISEWCTKIALSTSAITSTQAKFSVAADQIFQDLTGTSPPDA